MKAILITLFCALLAQAGTSYAATKEELAERGLPDLNRSRPVIVINAKRLAVADYLRAAQNEIEAIAAYAGEVAKLAEQNDSLRAELEKLKKAK